MRVGQMQEIRAKCLVDGVELGVIEEVEVFPTEVESGLLVDRELLEQAEVKVDASRQIESVAPDIAEREPLRGGESGRLYASGPGTDGSWLGEKPE